MKQEAIRLIDGKIRAWDIPGWNKFAGEFNINNWAHADRVLRKEYNAIIVDEWLHYVQFDHEKDYLMFILKWA